MSIVNLEDLEKLTEKLYGPQQDPSLNLYEKSISDSYIQNYSLFTELFELFITTKSNHCQFWILNKLINLVQTKYNNFSDEEKLNFRKILLFLFENKIDKISSTTFINGKFCLLLINWMINDFPENWSNFFKDFMNLSLESSEEGGKIHKINTFIEMMVIFDDELIKFRHIQNQVLFQRSTIIKDYLRADGINEIVSLLFQIIQNHQFLDIKLVKNSMRVIARLIDWNQLHIFTDCVNYITEKLMNNFLLSESLEVINSIIHKGMDPPQKVEVIKYLKINQILDSILKPNIQAEGHQIKMDEGIFFKICEIVSNLGIFSNDSYESFKNSILGIGASEITDEQQAFFLFINEQVNYSIYHTISIINMSRKFDQKSIYQICDFLNGLISSLKNNDYIIDILLETLKALIKCLENNLILPKSYDLKTTIPNKNDEELNNFRREFFTIYNNLYCLKPLKNFVLKSLLEKFQKISLGQSSLREVELALYLINVSFSYVDSTNHPEINSIISLLFNINFSNFQSKFLVLNYFEATFKYLLFKINDFEILGNLLKLYFSPIGIMNEDFTYSAQVSAILNKLLDKSKNNLDKLANYIIFSFKEYFELILKSNNLFLISENSVNFNSLSMIVGLKSVDEVTRYQIFEYVLQYFNKIIHFHGLDEEKFNEICKIITNFLKSIGYEVANENKKNFIEFFNDFINNYYLNLCNYTNTSSKIKYALITILQRLILILGKDSFNFLVFFFNEQVKVNDPEIMEDTMKLLQNSVQVMKKDSVILVSEYFNYFFAVVKSYNIPVNSISEIDKNIISLYSNFVKLIANILAEIPEVIFDNTIKNFNFSEILNFLYMISYEIVDSTTKRSSFKCLKSITLIAIKLIVQNPDNSNLFNVLEFIIQSSFKIFSKLSICDPLEVNILMTHCQIMKNLNNFYMNYITNMNKANDPTKFFNYLIEFEKKSKINDYINLEFKKLSDGM